MEADCSLNLKCSSSEAVSTRPPTRKMSLFPRAPAGRHHPAVDEGIAIGGVVDPKRKPFSDFTANSYTPSHWRRRCHPIGFELLGDHLLLVRAVGAKMKRHAGIHFSMVELFARRFI